MRRESRADSFSHDMLAHLKDRVAEIVKTVGDLHEAWEWFSLIGRLVFGLAPGWASLELGWFEEWPSGAVFGAAVVVACAGVWLWNGLAWSASRLEYWSWLRERRKEKIDRWRDTLGDLDTEEEEITVTTVYSELRPYLDDEVRQRLESGRHVEVGPRGRPMDWKKRRILDLITELEHEWGLV